MSSTLTLYDRFRKFPFGNILISRALAFRAPYFSTIHPQEMTVQYVKKARGKLVGECSIDPGILVPGDIKVPLEIKDGTGDTVLSAVIVFHISERKSANGTA